MSKLNHENIGNKLSLPLPPSPTCVTIISRLNDVYTSSNFKAIT